MTNNTINLINIDLNDNSNIFIKKSFDIAFKIIKKNQSYKLINGPIDKSKFLNKKFLGMTEYVSKKFNVKKIAMLIYNKQLSVCPVTTHLPLKIMSKNINKNIIKEKIVLISKFYKENLDLNQKLPSQDLIQCETNKFSKIKIIEAAINH